MDANFMNGSLVQDPQHMNNVRRWLESMGYDVAGMFPQEFGIEQAGAMYGNPNMPGGSGVGPGQRYSGGMPGGSGWDGANAKLAWMAQRAMANRRAAKQARAGGAGGGAGMGAMSNADMDAMQGAATAAGGGGRSFGDLVGLLGKVFR